MQGSVGDHEADLAGLGAQHLQAAQAHGAGGGAIAVVVGHDADVLVLLDGVGQQAGGFQCALQFTGRQQFGGGIVQFINMAHAA